MDELKKKLEELGRAFEEFKKINEQRLAEIKATGSASSMTEEKLSKAEKDVERLSGAVDALKKENETIRTAMNRVGQGADDAKSVAEKKAQELKAAQNAYLRKGDRTLSAEHAQILAEHSKALSSDSDTDGGYLVRPELSAKIVEKEFESTPMRELADVETVSGKQLDVIQDLDEAASGWVAEQGARSDTTTPTLKQSQIAVHELYASPKATQGQLDDAMWDIEKWLAKKVGAKFGRDEATAFVSGTGVGKPRGFLTYPSGTSFGQIEQVVSGNAALIQADGLFSLQNSLKESYQANATWLLQRASVSSVRKLKDGTGRYIWQPGLTESAPAMILGRPYRMASDMPAEGAGNLSVAYGDFRQGYLIVDRIGIRTLRDPFTSKPYVIFYTTKRVGGDVVNFEAIKLGKCSA